jgi:hypothetical protein
MPPAAVMGSAGRCAANRPLIHQAWNYQALLRAGEGIRTLDPKLGKLAAIPHGATPKPTNPKIYTGLWCRLHTAPLEIPQLSLTLD